MLVETASKLFAEKTDELKVAASPWLLSTEENGKRSVASRTDDA
ncbi:hypothetical protein RE6C_02512 [Rhodopirellula europaea 6C]|uniref:Uncharacterized protein n=1 Tax=Rhodopirellula europaea 6C TaxID=1263867 RepID=M2AVE7_9BACT|nr:hypothetical protein RE6C_02512 [Rhodopirellula europaea 6C]